MASPVQEIVSSVQLSATSALLYQAPPGVWVQIMALRASNADTSIHTVTFNVVPSGGSVGVANQTTPPLAVLPGSVYPGTNEYGLVLNPGDALWGNADTAAVVNCFASGLLSTS